MDLKDIAQSILAGLGGPWLDQAKGQMAKDISAYQSGGVPALMANTQGTADLAGGFGGNTKAVGIRAYHGSPYDFDKFDLSKIGTGEGAQAYGHGLYFAENPKVAQEYRDRLQPTIPYQALKSIESPDVRSTANHLLEAHGATVAEARLRAMAAKYPDFPDLARAADIIATQSKAPGRMYEVNINASPEQFLDWDKGGEQIYRGLQNYTPLSGSAEDMMMQLVRGKAPQMSSREASEALLAQGIPGIRYLDQGSRTGGQGTSNYVVFNPDIVEILKKYGIVAAPAAGALMPPEQQAPVF